MEKTDLYREPSDSHLIDLLHVVFDSDEKDFYTFYFKYFKDFDEYSKKSDRLYNAKYKDLFSDMLRFPKTEIVNALEDYKKRPFFVMEPSKSSMGMIIHYLCDKKLVSKNELIQVIETKFPDIFSRMLAKSGPETHEFFIDRGFYFLFEHTSTEYVLNALFEAFPKQMKKIKYEVRAENHLLCIERERKLAARYPTEKSLKRLMKEMWPDERDFDGFVLDAFTDIYRRFTNGMNTDYRYNLLFEKTDRKQILNELKRRHREQIKKFNLDLDLDYEEFKQDNNQNPWYGRYD